MKICAACHEHLPKESYSKKQWKLDECQRRCKVCTAKNREVQPIPKKQDKDTNNYGGLVTLLDSMCLGSIEKEISDEQLFAPPPPSEDCPICFIRIPTLSPTGKKHMTCCGKVICSGCMHAPVYDSQGNEVSEEKCPFCRTLYPITDEEAMERLKKRVEANDPIALFNRGNYYRKGRHGFSQSYTKALKLYHKAGELGCSLAYCNVGWAFDHGRGVDVDKKKALYYYELAAMRGDECARYNLGQVEWRAGNMERAFRHFMIAISSGDSDCLETIKRLYSDGQATKEVYTKALRAYQAYLFEIKSDARDKAAAFSEEFRYY